MSHRGQTIGQENHTNWAFALVRSDLEGGLQRIRNCSAADWFEVGDETVRTFAMIGVSWCQLAEKRLRFGREPDDLEAIRRH